ncbi:hypothetical protein AVEN_43207-1 [Araneus ventricosus]|uniref:Uncharacterized protein n=1 Tax=Araneus ventricosus TaxID=182803 RepID=A0A4Y2K1H2_ARAVE|nr:hypothetical protein AVEN_43207-1 [Araneus ventricosus]
MLTKTAYDSSPCDIRFRYERFIVKPNLGELQRTQRDLQFTLGRVGMLFVIPLEPPTNNEPASSNLQTTTYSKVLPKTPFHWQLTSDD